MKDFKSYLAEARELSSISESEEQTLDSFMNIINFALEDSEDETITDDEKAKILIKASKEARTMWKESGSEWMGDIDAEDLKKVEKLDSKLAKEIQKFLKELNSDPSDPYDDFMTKVNSALELPEANPNIKIVGPKKSNDAKKTAFALSAAFYWNTHKPKDGKKHPFVTLLKKKSKDKAKVTEFLDLYVNSKESKLRELVKELGSELYPQLSYVPGKKPGISYNTKEKK